MALREKTSDRLSPSDMSLPAMTHGPSDYEAK
jgi:hypothetical protein